MGLVDELFDERLPSPPCACKRYGCVKPAASIGRWELDKTPTQAQLFAHQEVDAWYRAQPDPVVITPDGEMWAVNPGYTALDVVQAWHAENAPGDVSGADEPWRGNRRAVSADHGVDESLWPLCLASATSMRR